MFYAITCTCVGSRNTAKKNHLLNRAGGFSYSGKGIPRYLHKTYLTYCTTMFTIVHEIIGVLDRIPDFFSRYDLEYVLARLW